MLCPCSLMLMLMRRDDHSPSSVLTPHSGPALRRDDHPHSSPLFHHPRDPLTLTLFHTLSSGYLPIPSALPPRISLYPENLYTLRV
jgi:hypothetical protein